MKFGLTVLVMLSVLDAPLSDAATRSGADGRRDRGLDGDRQGRRCGADVAGHIRRLGGDAVDSGRQGVVAVMVHFPFAAATPVPTAVAPSNRVTVLPACGRAGEGRRGDVGDVVAVVDAPVSDAAVRSGADGTAGGVVSMVTGKAADATLMLPATSVALAVMLCTPSARVVAVMLQFPPVA